MQLKDKLHYIQPVPLSDKDLINKLRRSTVGKIYFSYLKRINFCRSLAIKAWRFYYPIYVEYHELRHVKRHVELFYTNYPLVPLSQISNKKINNADTWDLFDAEIINTPPPIVFPLKDKIFLKSPHDRYIFPKIFVTTIYSATLTGGTNLIRSNGQYICHDLYDFVKDYTSEELHGRTVINSKKKVHWRVNDLNPESISFAATFVDALASNYAHWMTEVLPRISVFCSDDRFNDVPLVVNDGLHSNIMDSLFAVTGNQRKIIVLPIGRMLEVGCLYTISPTGYVPFEPRRSKYSGQSHGLFSAYAFKQLRIKFQDVVTPNGLLDGSKRKIYIRRNSHGRNIVNAHQIELLLLGRGFEIIEPETLTLNEQISIFSNAEIIVGCSGAAMANIIFCQSDAHIVILIPKIKKTCYWYWQNIACANNNSVVYVMGQTQQGMIGGIHSDFKVDPHDLLSAVNV